MKSITKRIISTLAICGALVLEAGATAIGSLGKALNNIAKVNAADTTDSIKNWNTLFGTSYDGTVTGIKANSFTLSGNTASGISVIATNGSSTNGYVKDADFRMYNGYKLTISAPTNYNVTSITANKGGKTISGLTADVGTLSIASGSSSMSWTGKSSEVVISVSATMSFADMSITISSGSTPPSTTYSVNYLKNTTDTVTGMPNAETNLSPGLHTLSTTKPTRSGYDFIGWNTDSAATTGITSLTISSADIDVYAIWKATSSGGEGESEGTFSGSVEVSGIWTATGGTKGSSYYKLIKDAYIYNTTALSDIDCSKSVAITLNMRTVGGTSYKNIKVTAYSNAAMTTAISTEQTITATDGANLADATLDFKFNENVSCNSVYFKFLSGSGSGSNGPGVAKLTLKYTKPDTKKVESIAVKTAPKANYYENETFNPASLVITATYDDKTTEDIAYAGHESDFAFSPTLLTALKTTDTSVTITYKGKNITQTIQVNPDTISSVTLGGSVSGIKNEPWDLSKVTCTVAYASGRTTNPTDFTKATETAIPTANGDYNVVVTGSYGGVNATPKTYSVHVANSGKTIEDAMTVAEAYDILNEMADNTNTEEGYFVKGKVNGNISYNSSYGSVTFNFKDLDSAKQVIAYSIYGDAAGSEVEEGDVTDDETLYVFGPLIKFKDSKSGEIKLEIGYKKDCPTPYFTKGKVDLESIALDKTSASLEIGETLDLVVSFTPEDATDRLVTWTSSNDAVATVANGKVTAVSKGSTTITATSHDGGFTATCTVAVTEHVTKTFNLYSGDLVAGKYVIVSGSNAMKAAISNSRFENGSVTPEDNKIIDPAGNLIWEIEASGTNWLLYNASTEKYAGSTGSKNTGALLASADGDFAKWSCTYNEADGIYDFINIGRSEAASDQNNKYLRNNSNNGWAAYASSTGTKPTLYKLAEAAVIYDLNGASGTAPSKQTADPVTHKVTLAQPGVTRAGYYFAGWNTQSDGEGTEYSSGYEFEPTGEVTLYAHWVLNSHNVIYYQNYEGCPAETSVTYQYTKEVTVADKPSRSGWNFLGWNTKDDGTGTSYAPGAKFTMPDEDVPLYAQWSDKAVIEDLTITSDFETIVATGSNTTLKASLTISDGDQSLLTKKIKWSVSPTTAGSFTTSETADGVAPTFIAANTLNDSVTITAEASDNSAIKKSFTFSIVKPNDATVSSVEIIAGTDAKLSYFDNETTIDTTDLSVVGTETSATYTSFSNKVDSTSLVTSWSLDIPNERIAATVTGFGDIYKSIEVIPVAISKIDVIQGDTTYILGEQFDASRIKVIGTYNDSETHTIDVTAEATISCESFDPYKISDDYEVTVSYGTFDPVKFKVSVIAKPASQGHYELVTDASELDTSSTYLLVGVKNDSYFGIKQYVSGNNFKAALIPSPNEDGNIVFNSSTSYENTFIKLGGSEGEWTINDGSKYLINASSTDTSKLQGSDTATDNKTKWSITVSDSGVATIVSADTSITRNTIRFNQNGNNDPLFSVYASGQSDIYLYKFVTDPTTLIKLDASIKEGKTFNVGDSVAATDLNLEALFNDGTIQKSSKDEIDLTKVVLNNGETISLEKGVNTISVKYTVDSVTVETSVVVTASATSYEVSSDIDSRITTDPVEIPTSAELGSEFEIELTYDKFLYEIDIQNTKVEMEGEGTISLLNDVISTNSVTGKISIKVVLKEVTHPVELDSSVEGYTISPNIESTGITINLTLADHYVSLPSSIECSIDGTTDTKSYTVSDNKIVIPAEDVTGKVTLLTSATHADCSFVAGDIVGVEGSIISSPKHYKDNIDYTFTLKDGFDPETLTVTMTSYGSEFTNFELTKSGDEYHVNFVIVGDTVINVTAKAKITNNLTDKLITTSNTGKTIEVGANYSATLSFADGFNPDKTSVKVEMRDSFGDLQDITTSAYNSSTHGISITGVTGEIVITASTELKQYNVTLSGNNLLDSDYTTVAVSVDGKPATLVGGSVKVTHGEFIQILVTLKDGKQYAEGYPICTMGGSTVGLDWKDGKLTVDSLTGDLSFVANIEKIGVSAAMQYDVTIIENTKSPEAIYQGEEVVYEFVIINPKAYEFDQETSKIETYVGGVLKDLTNESGVWYYDDDSGILRITISNPNTHVGIKIGHRYIEYSVTSPEDAKFYSLDVPETIHYGDKDVAIKVVADDHCHVDGVKVYLGTETLTVNVDYEYSNGVVTIKEIKGNYVIEATAAHDDVTITLDSSSENIAFTLDDPQVSYAYETTITGYFSVVAPYKLPASIKVFEYGVEIGNDKYFYSPTTGVFSIKAEGDITIIAKGSLGTVTVGLSDESSVNASLSPTPEAEYDEGASFEATVLVDSGYQIASVVVKMGGNSIKAFNPYDNSIFILNLTGNVEITVVTEKIYCDVYIISYNGYSDGDAISSIEYGLPLEVTFTPYDGYHLDEYDTFYGTMGGEDISAYYSNGVLSIPEVTGAIDVSFQGWPNPYTVTTYLGESTLDTDVYVLEHGDEFFGQVTPNEGYKIISMVVTMGGSPVTVTDYGFDILSVTGDVVITVVTEKITHTITNTLTNATNSNTTDSVDYGAQYVANISADEGYENLAVRVEMGGVDVTSSYYSNGVIIIPKVTGDIEVIATASIIECNITWNLDHVTSDQSTIDKVNYGSNIEVALEEDDNYFDLKVTVTVNGVPVSVTLDEDSKFTLSNITGDVVITASATEIVATHIEVSMVDNEITYNTDLDDFIGVIIVELHYNDDSYETMSPQSVTGYNKNQVGAQTLTINAAGFNAELEIVVVYSDTISSISATANKDNFTFGETFDKTNVVVTATYDDTHTAVIEVSDVTGYDITKSGNQTLTVKAGGKECSLTITVKASTVVSSISAVANKDNLTYGEAFTKDDVTVTATYTDNLTGTIDAEFVEFAGIAGSNTVVVHAAGKTCTVEVTVKASEVIDHIDALPNDISYAYGYELKASDFAVTATYTDGHIGTVDATSVVAEDLVPGLNVVVVKVGELSCNVVVKVDDSTVIDSISAVIKDGKDTVAYEGAFTADDVTVYATYTDGKTKVVTGFTMSGFDNKHIGVNTVTITLDGKTCTVKVTVLASTVVDHIEAIATKDNLTYGDTLTKDDVKVTEVYTDGHKVENLAADSISGFTGKVGVNNVTVVYGGKEASIQVTVKASEVIESIEAVVNEGKAELEYGAAFTKDDVTVTATYTDGHPAVVAADSVDFAGTVGENTVVVHVGDKTCEVKVTVKASEVITGIEVSTEKTNVEYGGTFTKDDVKAQYVYSDGHKVDATVDSISGFSATTLGKQVITVNVGEYSATLEITVSGRVALSIEVIGYNDIVDQGKDYVFTGKVIAHYNDGTTEEVTGYTMEAVDTSRAGKKTVKVSFENVSTTFDINVIQTKTEIEPTAITAIIGGSVVGVAILAVGIFLFLKSFKL